MGISYLLNKKITAQLIILILFTSILPGCGAKKENQPKAGEMKFNVDTSKLGAFVVDSLYNLSFNPPLGWNEVGKKQIDEAGKAISKALAGTSRITVKPVFIFVNDTSGSVLNVAEIRLDSVKSDLDSQVAEYEKIMFSGKDSLKIKKAFYMKDGIKIAQFLIQKNGFVNFRLLFENGKGNLLQFDYLSKIEDYSNEVKAIESSIGSIKLIKTY